LPFHTDADGVATKPRVLRPLAILIYFNFSTNFNFSSTLCYYQSVLIIRNILKFIRHPKQKYFLRYILNSADNYNLNVKIDRALCKQSVLLQIKLEFPKLNLNIFNQLCSRDVDDNCF